MASVRADTHDAVEADLERRTQGFVRRDREYKTKIELLEAELLKAKSSSTPSLADLEAEKHMSKLRDLHGTIVTNIDHVQEQTARILQEQERDLLRAFRARLFDLQTELEKEKARAEDGAAVWIEKNRQLQKELDWAKEMADRLDRHNQSLSKENARLKNQFKTQEDDREYLIKQLVAAKKDNSRLRQEVNKGREELETLSGEIEDLRIKIATKSTGDASPSAEVTEAFTSVDLANDDVDALVGTSGATTADENRYRDVIVRLKKLLDAERKAARQARAQLMAELSARSEAEMFLRRAIEDAKAEIDRKRQAVLMSSIATAPKLGGLNGRATSAQRRGAADVDGLIDMYTALSKEDREQILASLLAQEHVLVALQRVAFPTRPEGDAVGMAPDTTMDNAAGFSTEQTVSAAKSWSKDAMDNAAAALDAQLGNIDERISMRAKAGSSSPVPSPRTVSRTAASQASSLPAPSPVDRFKASTLGKTAHAVLTSKPDGASLSGRPASGARPPSSEPFVPASHKVLQNTLAIQSSKAPLSPTPSRTK